MSPALLAAIGAGSFALAAVAFLTWFFSSQRQEFREQVGARLSRLVGRIRGARKVRVGTMMVPVRSLAQLEKEVRPVRYGSLAFPLRLLVGGDGELRYEHPDGVQCRWSNSPRRIPKDLAKAQAGFLEKRQSAADARGAVFVNRPQTRLDEYEFGLRPPDDDPWPLLLRVSTTDFFETQATNTSLDELLPGGKTLREKYAEDVSNIGSSVLANPLAVNLSVVTSDHRILLSIRSRKTALNPGGYSPAVSETGHPHLDCLKDGTYSPFLTAKRGVKEEILSREPSVSSPVMVLTHQTSS